MILTLKVKIPMTEFLIKTPLRPRQSGRFDPHRQILPAHQHQRHGRYRFPHPFGCGQHETGASLHSLVTLEALAALLRTTIAELLTEAPPQRSEEGERLLAMLEP